MHRLFHLILKIDEIDGFDQENHDDSGFGFFLTSSLTSVSETEIKSETTK